MMPSGFMLWFFRALFFHADTRCSPTRAVEYLLAWCIIFWSGTTFIFSSVMSGPAYTFMIALAPEKTWGAAGVAFGVLRVAALIINGSWRRTPILRFIGAGAGFIWWVTVGGLFWLGVRHGAAPFPMLGAYPVLAFFEAYSCHRCGQDACAMNSLSMAPRVGRLLPGDNRGG